MDFVPYGKERSESELESWNGLKRLFIPPNQPEAGFARVIDITEHCICQVKKAERYPAVIYSIQGIPLKRMKDHSL